MSILIQNIVDIIIQTYFIILSNLFDWIQLIFNYIMYRSVSHTQFMGTFTFSYCLALFSRVLWFQRLTAVLPKTRTTETRYSRPRPTIRQCHTNVNTGTYYLVSQLGGAVQTESGQALRRNVKVNVKKKKRGELIDRQA